MRKCAFRRQMAVWCLLAGVGGAAGFLTLRPAHQALAADPPASTYTGYAGITAPSDQRGLNFNVPGVVHVLKVKEGQEITADDQKKSPTGQMLVAQQDDSVDLAEMVVKQAEAKSSELQIKAAEEDLKQKRVELDRDKEMFSKHVLGKSELEKAELDVTIGMIRVSLAEQETEQKNQEVNAQKARVEQKKLYATITGVVQKINVHDGELATNDPKTPCIIIVKNDPLWVEVDIPVADAKTFQGRDPKAPKTETIMEARYLDEAQWADAPVIYINPVANAAAGTQRVRLELLNPRKLRSGLQVEVRLKGQKGVAGALPNQ